MYVHCSSSSYFLASVSSSSVFFSLALVHAERLSEPPLVESIRYSSIPHMRATEGGGGDNKL